MSKVIDINGSIRTVTYTTGSPADITVNSVSVGSAPSGGSLDIVVNLDGSPSGSWDGDSWEITSDPFPDTTLQVNGTTEGTVASGSTVDIQLSDSIEREMMRIQVQRVERPTFLLLTPRLCITMEAQQ
jgi:hypothetical protein